MEMDIAVFAVQAFMIVGAIQWLKALVEKVAPGAPTWIYVAALPVVAAAVGFVPVGGVVWIAWGAGALAQLGYELIVQTVKNKLGGDA